MTVLELLQLDTNLVSTWQTYAQQLKDWLSHGAFDKAIALIENTQHPELAYTEYTSGPEVQDYVQYVALAYMYNDQPGKALATVKKAFTYGFPRFYLFDRGYFTWEDTTSVEYKLFKPLLEDPAIQKYVKAVPQEVVIPQEADIAKIPFCWFERSTPGRKNTRCHISGKKLEKEQEVYQFRFFNGADDIPTGFFYADSNAFEQHPGAVENLRKYRENGYQLSDYKINVGYSHPLINQFWHQPDRFDVLDTLQMISGPPVNPSPYERVPFDSKPLSIYDKEKDGRITPDTILQGTGGEFMNLLYVLIKCGYQEAIFGLLPQLPKHFPLLLMCFQSKTIRQQVSQYLNLPDLPALWGIAMKNYARKTPGEVKKLGEFGKDHPELMEQLATVLNLYELHLYSHSHPGINWFFEDFRGFTYAKGGGLLDFLITAPELIPAIDLMKNTLCYLTEVSGFDAYENTMPFLYRTMMLHYTWQEDEAVIPWIEMPTYIQNSLEQTVSDYTVFGKIYDQTIKVMYRVNPKMIDNLLQKYRDEDQDLYDEFGF